MSCNNYTATQIPLSVGFDANGNAGSLVETKEIKVTKIEAYKDPESDAATPLIIDAGEDNEIIFPRNVRIDGTLTAATVTVQGASALSSLTDVTITSVANGEVLVWSSNDWINRTLAEAGILGTTDLANYATNTYVSSNYATSNSLSAYAPSSWVNSNFLANSTIGTTVQAYGTALQAIRALTPAADRLPFFNGGSTAATATLTSFARNNLLNANDGPTVLTNIGGIPSNQNLQDIIDIGTPTLGSDTYVIAWSDSNNKFELQAQTGGGASVLNDLNDVTITTAVANDFLVYESGQWRDQAPSVARTSLGATTVGANIFTLNNPTAVRYLKINDDNSVSTRTAVEMQSDLSVTPGTNVQTQNANLQSIANQTTTENTLIYFSGSTSAATTTLTSFGRSLLDDANATECRGTLSAQVSALSLDNIKSICDGSGASSFGRLLYTVPNSLGYGINILPVPLFDSLTIANNYGKVLSLRDPGFPSNNVLAQPQFQFLFLGELGNVDLGGGAGTGGNLTAGRILYVNPSQNLTQLANPAGTSFLRHDGANTGPTWRSSADVRTDIGLATTDSPQFAGVNVGNAADTLIARSSAGNITVAGQTIYRAGGTDVPISDGGTGASTAAGARANILPGSPANGDILFYNGSDFVYLKKPGAAGTYKLRMVVSIDLTPTISWASDGA